MRKPSTVKVAGRPARVRLVVLDAELPDGDLGSFNQVLQNALRGPATTIVQSRINGGAAKVLTHQPEADEDTEVEAEDIADETEDEIEVSVTPQPRAKRSPPKTPKAVPIDMNSGVTLEVFVQGKDVGSQAKKYLVASAWLKEHRETDAVTGGHMYTCFKSMGWSTNIPDFSQPLRDLKAKQQYYDKSDKGYEINHLGLDYVTKLGKANGAG